MSEAWAKTRRYHSDDRDQERDNNDLVVSMGGNGDWYITIVKHGEKIGPTVRLTTSGTPRGYERVPRAVSLLYNALAASEELPELPVDESSLRVAKGCCRKCGHHMEGQWWKGTMIEMIVNDCPKCDGLISMYWEDDPAWCNCK